MNLSQEQQQAVTRSGQDVCVVAGPGSGKTRVLVERFAWLVEEGKAEPDRILAFTFTEKAASEIKTRLVGRFNQNAETRERMERAWVSTMHGFCARLLREYAIAAGIDPQFVVLDEQQAAEELAEAAETALNELVASDMDGFRALAGAVSTYNLAGDLAKVYDALRIGAEQADFEPPLLSFDAFVDEVRAVMALPLDGWTDKQKAGLAEVREWLSEAASLCGKPACEEHIRLVATFKCNLKPLKNKHAVTEGIRDLKERAKDVAASLASQVFEPQRLQLLALLDKIGAMYSAAKRRRSALDFADLEWKAIELLRDNCAVRSSVQGLFDAILMDELQDTNPLQWALVDLIRKPGGLFAVGDINQSIYGFRHAEPEVFAKFQKDITDSDQVVDRLRDNHRTREEILKAVEAIAGSAAGMVPPEFSAQRPFDPPAEPPVEVQVIHGEAGEDLAAREARWIAHRIRELEAGGAGFGEIAVLVRKAKLMEPLEDAMQEFGIPCVVSRGSGFFDVLEVTDLVRWMRVLDNPRDEVSMATVLRSPLVGASDETLLRMREHGIFADALENVPALGLDPEEAQKLSRFARQLKELRPLAGYLSPDRLITRAMDDCDYEGGLTARGRSNVEKFLSLVRDLWTDAPCPLPELLDKLDAYRKTKREPEAPPDAGGSAVRIMSIHAAKGLEFPVVFLPSLQSGAGGQPPCLCFSQRTGLGVRWRVDGVDQGIACARHREISRKEQERQKEEASRLFFVAMTRAERHLVLSQIKKKSSKCEWGKMTLAAFGIDADEIDSAPHVHGPVRVFRTNADAPPSTAEAAAQTANSVQLVDPPSRDGQYESTSSVSALLQFLECPRRYLLGRFVGWRSAALASFDPEEELPDDELSGAELGTAVHSWLSGQRDGQPEAEVLELASRFENSELGQRATKAAKIGREHDFIFALNDVVLRGQIDLWFEEGGEVLLVDYKTDREPDLEKYSLQLRFYAAALSRMLGKPVSRAYVYLLREDRAVPVALNGEADLESLIGAFRGAHEHLDFPLRETDACRFCDFYAGLCPAGRK